MRILFFTATLDVGGCQINAINLARGLKDRGHDVSFFGHPGSLLGRLESLGIGYHAVDYAVRHPSFNVMKALARCVEEGNFEVVQAFDPMPMLEAYGSQNWHRRPVFAMITSQRLPTFRLPRLRQIALVNPHTKQRYVEQLGWPGERLMLIPERLDCEFYRPMGEDAATLYADLSLDRKLPLVTMVSRLHRLKRSTVQLFLETAAQWGELYGEPMPVQFAIAGAGPESRRLRQRASELGLEGHVRWLGEVLDVPSLMNISSVVIGMASTCQQALGCGRPVITIGDKGFSEVVSESSFESLAAYHFNVHHVQQNRPAKRLCMLIRKILVDVDYADQLGRFGRAMALERYDSRLGAAKLEKVYERLLQSPVSGLARLTTMGDWALSFGSYFAYWLRSALPAASRRSSEDEASGIRE